MGKVLKTLATVGFTALAIVTLNPEIAFLGLTGTWAATAAAWGVWALGTVSKMLAPKNRLDSGQELRSPIRSATPPRLLCYGLVILPGVQVFKPGYGVRS